VKDVIVLVSGGGRGIGRAIALGFARRGARVVACARTEREIEETAARCEEVGPPALAIRLDVRDETGVAALAARVLREFGRVDVLVNSAGVYASVPVAETTPTAWRETIETNLTGPFLLTRALLPALRRSAKGHVFMIGSIASRRAFPGCGAYCASKFGLLGLTEVLREELREPGIRVTSILPGATDTAAWDEKGFDRERGKMIRPEEVAEALLSAYALPRHCSIDEVSIAPASGPL
jgi:NAD(P)-dependent dehydrogenase (short-subunit alcohol dehydrogenase family)